MRPFCRELRNTANLNRDCFEYLHHLYDDPTTHFALLFDGGDGCWEVLAREPMLRSRIYRRVAFRSFGDADVLALIPGYHPIYAEVDPELLVWINDKAANGRLRPWARVHAHPERDLARCRGGAHQRGDRPQRYRLKRILSARGSACGCDCAQRLSPGEFERVDRLLAESLKTLGAWHCSMGYPNLGSSRAQCAWSARRTILSRPTFAAAALRSR